MIDFNSSSFMLFVQLKVLQQKMQVSDPVKQLQQLAFCLQCTNPEQGG